MSCHRVPFNDNPSGAAASVVYVLIIMPVLDAPLMASAGHHRTLNPKQMAAAGQPIPHYHPRVILTSVMITKHPDVVFSAEVTGPAAAPIHPE